jgi:hypothetical protein
MMKIGGLDGVDALQAWLILQPPNRHITFNCESFQINPQHAENIANANTTTVIADVSVLHLH